MKLTQFLGLKKPDKTDGIKIGDINDNMDALDTAINGKADASGGDISSTVIKTVTASVDSYPVPKAGDSIKVAFGKIIKFFQDVNSFRQTVVLISQIANNTATNNPNLPLSAAMGYSLQNQINDVNSNIAEQLSDTGWLDILGTSVASANITAPLFGGNPVQYRKKNGVVYIQGKVGVKNKTSAYLDLFTLPDGYRSDRSDFSIYTCSATKYSISRYIIYPTGLVALEWAFSISANTEYQGSIDCRPAG